MKAMQAAALSLVAPFNLVKARIPLLAGERFSVDV